MGNAVGVEIYRIILIKDGTQIFSQSVCPVPNFRYLMKIASNKKGNGGYRFYSSWQISFLHIYIYIFYPWYCFHVLCEVILWPNSGRWPPSRSVLSPFILLYSRVLFPPPARLRIRFHLNTKRHCVKN